MVDEQKLRELADQLICHPVSRSIEEIESAGEAIKSMMDELQQLRSERTALLVNEQNLEAAVKRARVDALEEAKKEVSLEEISEAEAQEPCAWRFRRLYGSDGMEKRSSDWNYIGFYPGPAKDVVIEPLFTSQQPVAQPGEAQAPIAYLYHDAAAPKDAHPWLHSTMLVLATDRRPGLRGETPLYAAPVTQAKPEQAACEQTIKNELPMLSISDEQAEAIASEVYARNPVDSVDAAFKLDWELVRAGVSHAKALSTDDSCPHGNAHMVHDCLRCGAPVCCGKCCADDAANEPNVAGEIAYQLTKKLVIDMPTARAAVDAAIAALPVSQPLTQEQRRALIDAAGDKTDGLNQDDFADEIVRAVERHHGITASPKE